jgi:hypothetical protein
LIVRWISALGPGSWLHQGAPLPSSPAEFDACDPISQVAVRVDVERGDCLFHLADDFVP